MHVLAFVPVALLLAQPASPSSVSGDLDGDGQPETITWQAPDLVIERGGAVLGRVPAPAGAVGAPELRFLAADDLPVVHADWRLGDGRHHAELVVHLAGGQPEVIFSGGTGPVGDGEREEKLRVDEDGIVRYQRAPGMVRCDGEDVLFPELYDPQAKRFRPVSLSAPRGTPLTATTALPTWAGVPPAGLFRYTAASSQLGDERRADWLAAPAALEDDHPGHGLDRGHE